MIVCGVDPSSKKVAIVGSVDDEVVYEVGIVGLRFEPDNTLRADAVVSDFLKKVGKRHPYEGVAYIEEPIFGKSRRAGIVQAYVAGAVMQSFLRRGWKVQLVANTEWKKEVIGSGNANKQDIAGFLAHTFSVPVSILADGDLTDAYGIWMYGMEIERRARKVPGV